MTDTARRIEQVSLSFRAYGYEVVSSPCEGQEDLYLARLNQGFARLMERFEHNAKTYGFRGRSKRAIAALHLDDPSPAWGVQILID